MHNPQKKLKMSIGTCQKNLQLAIVQHINWCILLRNGIWENHVGQKEQLVARGMPQTYFVGKLNFRGWAQGWTKDNTLYIYIYTKKPVTLVLSVHFVVFWLAPVHFVVSLRRTKSGCTATVKNDDTTREWKDNERKQRWTKIPLKTKNRERT